VLALELLQELLGVVLGVLLQELLTMLECKIIGGINKKNEKFNIPSSHGRDRGHNQVLAE
jgi:hypothetical protein